MNIFEYIDGIKKNIETVNLPEEAKEFLAIYSIAEQMTIRYAELSIYYNGKDEADAKYDQFAEAAQIIGNIASQDMGRALYDGYMTQIPGVDKGEEQ